MNEREIAELEKAQAEATGWGAGVGARHERLKALYAERAPSPPQDVREALAGYEYQLPPQGIPAIEELIGLAAEEWGYNDTLVKNARNALAALAQSDTELRLEEDAQGKRAMLGGYQMPDALIPSLEAQSDAQPVAWRWRWHDDSPDEWHFVVNEFGGKNVISEPLYTAPPRPDASGLIETACVLDKRADEYVGANEPIEQGYRMAARYLRARAADRSEK
jgi:hypothetical protein